MQAPTLLPLEAEWHVSAFPPAARRDLLKLGLHLTVTGSVGLELRLGFHVAAVYETFGPEIAWDFWASIC